MDTAVLCGIISAASAIIVSVITAVYNNKLIIYRLEQLEKKMDKHNGLIERVYNLEEARSVTEERLRHLEKEVNA